MQTINIKRIMDNEIKIFKARKDIYLPDLQLSKEAVGLMRDITKDFVRNLINEALKDVRIEKRLMPVFINDILTKRLDLIFIDSIIPKPRNLMEYAYKPRINKKIISEFKL